MLLIFWMWGKCWSQIFVWNWTNWNVLCILLWIYTGQITCLVLCFGRRNSEDLSSCLLIAGHLGFGTDIFGMVCPGMIYIGVVYLWMVCPGMVYLGMVCTLVWCRLFSYHLFAYLLFQYLWIEDLVGHHLDTDYLEIEHLVIADLGDVDLRHSEFEFKTFLT